MCWIVEIFCKFAKFVCWINGNYDMSAYVTLYIMFLCYIVKWINEFPCLAVYCPCYSLYCHIKYASPRGCWGKGLGSLRDGLLNWHTVIQEEAGVLKSHRGYQGSHASWNFMILAIIPGKLLEKNHMILKWFDWASKSSWDWFVFVKLWPYEQSKVKNLAFRNKTKLVQKKKKCVFRNWWSQN